MESARAGSLLRHLSQVPDPRGRKGRRHPLSAMLTAVVCGILCGARGYASLVEWLHEQPVDVWHWMGYTRRPPKLDCFRDLLMKLDPAVLERALSEWIAEDLALDVSDSPLPAISLDGKVLCGTLRLFARAVHLLSMVDQRTHCVLSEGRVGENTNEHKAALELLHTLVVEGRVIVGDAMFCQRDLCQQIIDSGGDYCFAVKENQPELLRDIKLEFAAQDAAFSPLRPARTALAAADGEHDRQRARPHRTPHPDQHAGVEQVFAMAGSPASLPGRAAAHPPRPDADGGGILYCVCVSSPSPCRPNAAHHPRPLGRH